MWISIIFISIFGTLAHFLYDLSNHNKIIGLFAAVNESTWEHIKIAITPTLLYSIYDGYIYGLNPNYFFAKLISLLSIIIFIPLLFYGYKLILNKSIFILNIIIFYVTIFLSEYLFYYVLGVSEIQYFYRYLSCLFLFILFGCYLLLTLMPLKNFIFKDPLSKKYGFSGHRIK